jgi:hypothetical protein
MTQEKMVNVIKIKMDPREGKWIGYKFGMETKQSKIWIFSTQSNKWAKLGSLVE